MANYKTRSNFTITKTKETRDANQALKAHLRKAAVEAAKKYGLNANVDLVFKIEVPLEKLLTGEWSVDQVREKLSYMPPVSMTKSAKKPDPWKGTSLERKEA